MTDESSTSSVRLSDPVTVILAQAAHKLRTALKLAVDLGEPLSEQSLIRTAWAATQDAIDARGDK